MREFARHVIRAYARSDSGESAIEKTDNSTWECVAVNGTIELALTVYALDESVRGAYLDRRRAYFNGACVFPAPDGRNLEAIQLTIEPPDGGQDWRVATSMRAVDVDDHGFGVYTAADYEEFIDHPVEISDFSSVDFIAGGVPHRFVVSGRFESDLDRLAADLQQLCESQIQFFGGTPPFENYCFLGLATDNGYGGLEHRASSSLIFKRDDLPRIAEPGVPAGYQRLLGLCSHEYFHSWHVKRTRPLAFTPYRLQERNYTQSLWVFEGITSYYQELFLLRSGLIGIDAYLRRLGEMLTRVYRSPGRKLQSVAESSFDAWDVFYKPHSNSVNSSVSYYSKGAMVALALDLTLRKRHDSTLSLDTLVLELWRRYGSTGQGVPEDGFESLAKEIGGAGLEAFFDQAVRGTDDLPLQSLLADFGIVLEFRAATGPADRGGSEKTPDSPNTAWFGASWNDTGRGIEMITVLDGGPAQLGGLNPGDVLIAIDRLRVDGANFNARVARLEPGQSVVASVFRGGELLEFTVVLASPPLDSCVLSIVGASATDATQLRRAWLGE